MQAQAAATGLSAKDLGKETSNWVMVELQGLPKDKHSTVTPQMLADLLVRKRKGEVSGTSAKTILVTMSTTAQSAAEIIKAKGLTQVSDEGALEKIIDEVIAKNTQQVAQYWSGKEAVFGFFVGQVMKASGGMANPTKVNELLKRKLVG